MMVKNLKIEIIGINNGVASASDRLVGLNNGYKIIIDFKL